MYYQFFHPYFGIRRHPIVIFRGVFVVNLKRYKLLLSVQSIKIRLIQQVGEFIRIRFSVKFDGVDNNKQFFNSLINPLIWGCLYENLDGTSRLYADFFQTG